MEEEEKKSSTDIEKIKEDIDKMSTKDKYKFMFAAAADEIDSKKKKAASFIRRILDKFKADKDDVIEEESNDKPEK